MKHFLFLLFAGMLCISVVNAQKVVSATSEGVAVIDAANYSLTDTIRTGNTLYAVTSGNKAYASTQSSGKIYFIDLINNTITDSLALAVRKMAALKDSSILFGAMGKMLYRINTATKTIVDSIDVGGAIQYMTLRPKHNEIWISHTNMVEVVDFSSSLSKTSITAGSGTSDYGAIRFTIGGGMAYKMVAAKKSVYKINAINKTIVDTAKISTPLNNVNAIEVSPDSNTLFVASTGSKKLFFFNTSNMTLRDSSAMALGPSSLFRHPSKNEIWIVAHTDHNIMVYDEALNSTNYIIATPRFPRNVSFAIQTTGIFKLSSTNINVQLYPNPTTNNLSVLLPDHQQYQLTITSNLGRTIAEHNINGKQANINTANLAKGQYYLMVTDEKHNRSVLRFTKL